MAKNEIAVVNNFDLVTISGDLAEAIKEEMDGLGSIAFDKVKIPSGGGLAFEIPGEDGEEGDVEKTITGIILDHHPANAYWEDKFSGGNEQPNCSSFDGKQGLNRDTGELRSCEDCPNNQFRTDGAGKACKNVHRCYILREGNPVPLILTLPPTSLKYLRDYLGKRILMKGMRCYDAVTTIGLKKEESAEKITYSRATFSFTGKIPEAQRAEVIGMAKFIKDNYRKAIGLDNSDYNPGSVATSSAPGADGEFMQVSDAPENLPFV